MAQERSIRRIAIPQRLRIVLGSLGLVFFCLAARYYWGAESANAQTHASSTTNEAATDDNSELRALQSSSPAPREKKSAPAANAVVATVNNQRILRDELAQQCRRVHGVEVLESMVNKRLIIQECRRANITVTRKEVNDEIERMAKRFNIPVDQWMKMLKQERDITPDQYANDIIWPTLALRKIAGERLAIGHDELVREFEIEYGEAIRARLIAVSSPEKANKLHAQAVANPEDFGNLAKDYSEDAVSASAKGVINPIRKHGSYEEIENAVFHMADGDISPVIHAGGQYVILKREGLLSARPVKFEQVQPKLEEILRDRKMRSLAQDIFQKLQQNATVVNVWNDPVQHEKMPGVAATINNEPITIRELDEECIARHGIETLEGMINHKILEQACKRRNITITANEIDAEIARSALANVKPKADGSPDVDAWLALIAKKHNLPLEVYRQDIVWPTVALKKLVGNKVEVSEEDLRRGYEANYGPRVRCLAIVLDNQRRAQQVFEMARKNNTSKYFGELASQYSVEPGSQALNGEVPPIKRYGGQPQLEEEAFQLKPGELSGIIQLGDKFVLLRCEGYTKAADISFTKVRNDIYEDLYEKKVRLAMGTAFEELQEAATVDNFLAGTTHSPKEQKPGVMPSAQLPALREVPAE